MNDELSEKPEYFLFKEFYEGNQPYFYNTENYPWVKELEKDWEIILEEMGHLIGHEAAFENNSYYPPNLSSPTAWKNIVFFNYCWQNKTNRKKYPKTDALLNRIPNLTYAALCLLEPQSAVLPHYGDTNTTIRCHLGVKVPAGLPECGIRVGNEEKPWQDGKLLMFCDAQQHTTWNKTDQRRYVFTIDVMRQEYAEQKLSVCAKVLAVFSLKYFDQRVPFIHKLPQMLVTAVHQMLSIGWLLFLKAQSITSKQ